LRQQVRQFKSQAQLAKRDNQEIQANLGEYLKAIEDSTSEVIQSNRRKLKYETLAAQFFSVYPFKDGTPRNDLPVIGHYNNTRNSLSAVHTRENILNDFRRSGSNELERLISGLESQTANLPEPEDSQATTRLFGGDLFGGDE
jgi:hypothetical protein